MAGTSTEFPRLPMILRILRLAVRLWRAASCQECVTDGKHLGKLVTCSPVGKFKGNNTLFTNVINIKRQNKIINGFETSGVI